MSAGPEVSEVKKRAPTLYAIIASKLCKGLLLLALAFEFYHLSAGSLDAQFDQFLRFIQLDPEKQFFAELGNKLDKIAPSKVRAFAAGTFLYSLFSLIVGVGLIFRVSWAGWIAIGESAFFIPIEIYELSKSYSATVLVILLINVVIVWYLFQNRHRLFRHYHH